MDLETLVSVTSGGEPFQSCNKVPRETSSLKLDFDESGRPWT